MDINSFENRHIGANQDDIKKMLNTIGLGSVDELIHQTIPNSILKNSPLKIEDAITENDYLKKLKEIADLNKNFDNYIGQGYYGTLTPSVIKRNILCNPGWYTAYTPYQAEIAQGRLEALLNFQTCVTELTGMEIANASLLDESTAAAESMLMFFHMRSRSQVKSNVNKFFVSNDLYLQTVDVITARAEPLGIEIIFGDANTIELSNEFFGAIVQYPNAYGEIYDYSEFTSSARNLDIQVSVIADIMSLVLLKSPGSWGADVVVGSTQRFGVPMSYGGPHAAFFACKDSHKRYIPGRIIGVSLDVHGNPALRMALQTREQHIKRGKATSNICTAQALLAVMASMYVVYHGPKGLKNIAETIRQKTSSLKQALISLGYEINNSNHFDTISFKEDLSSLKLHLEKNEINVGYYKDVVTISVDETSSWDSLTRLANILAEFKNSNSIVKLEKEIDNPLFLPKNNSILEQNVFNSYHSETEMMRYIKKLENKDLSLVHGMISLGSCTMKLNAATEMEPITWPEFANLHPFSPVNQTQGFQQIFKELAQDLSEITGFDQVSLQPNSGAQGEYSGLMVIRAFHISNNEGHRNICLIPTSAHGTNPASAVMAGMEVVLIKCDELGNIDIEDLKEKASHYADNLSALMVTYPSTHGVFEKDIIEITTIIHEFGGQVYMDGANMNAQVGLTSPGLIGADVCHLNLHKTFAIPHGGGGPGMGPIGVAKHLSPFLPGNPIIKTGGSSGIKAINGAPWGSALILIISYGYIKLLGAKGLKKSTEIAILNANYLQSKLKDHFDVLYCGPSGKVAHEMILDCRSFKKDSGIEVEDIAKRLMDYGFHAPTVSFPVAGTLMVEPTESESLKELDRFAEAMIGIRNEIREIANESYDQVDNVLKNAPHTAFQAIDENWNHKYSRRKAVYPNLNQINNKFWPPVGRVDNAYGDRNLICSCLPLEEYEKQNEVIKSQ
ncbi:MAG: aminomethyl-transferring glycine dehydrogenase [Flavobacteriales bacterium]|nr:aminomethyl-transferring glycine dehydrogenase [Flavobacteriales bacterium]